MRARRSSAGQTLVELLVVLVLVGLLVSLASPSLREYVRRARLRAALDHVASDLFRARSLAARSGEEVYVLFEPRGAECLERYRLEQGAAHRRLLSVDLGVVAPGVCLSVRGRDTIKIDGRGLPRGAGRTVLARMGEGVDSLRISMVGRVSRWGYTVRWG